MDLSLQLLSTAHDTVALGARALGDMHANSPRINSVPYLSTEIFGPFGRGETQKDRSRRKGSIRVGGKMESCLS